MVKIIAAVKYWSLFEEVSLEYSYMLPDFYYLITRNVILQKNITQEVIDEHFKDLNNFNEYINEVYYIGINTDKLTQTRDVSNIEDVISLKYEVDYLSIKDDFYIKVEVKEG